MNQWPSHALQYIFSSDNPMIDGATCPAIVLCDTNGTPVPLTLTVVRQFVRLCAQVREHTAGNVGVVLMDPATGGLVDVQALMAAEEATP